MSIHILVGCVLFLLKNRHTCRFVNCKIHQHPYSYFLCRRMLIVLLSKLGLCAFRRLFRRMSMIDLFACLFAQHPTCHRCLSALRWWVRCSCPLPPAISSCGLLVCACVGLAGGLVWFGGCFAPFVGVVWSLRRPSAVCFLGVAVLASAAAAALHQCAVYLGAVHFTKSTHAAACCLGFHPLKDGPRERYIPLLTPSLCSRPPTRANLHADSSLFPLFFCLRPFPPTQRQCRMG